MEHVTENPVIYGNVDIRFGSVDMSNKKGEFCFLKEPRHKRWSFLLSGLKIIGGLEIAAGQLRSVKICTHFCSPLIVWFPTEEFANAIADLCGFKPAENKIFNPVSEVPSSQAIILSFSNTSAELKFTLHDVLGAYHQNNKLHRMASVLLAIEESRDILMAEPRLQISRRPSVKSRGLSGEVPSENDFEYLCLILGVGNFTKSTCKICFDIPEKTLFVYPDRMKSFRYPLLFNKIQQCTYDKDHLVAIFALLADEADRLNNSLLRVTAMRDLLTSPTLIFRKDLTLRVLFQRKPNMEQLGYHLSLLGPGWKGSRSTEHAANFSFNVFPGHPEFKHLER